MLFLHAGLTQHTVKAAAVNSAKDKATLLKHFKGDATWAGTQASFTGHSLACSSLCDRNILVFQGEVILCPSVQAVTI